MPSTVVGLLLVIQTLTLTQTCVGLRTQHMPLKQTVTHWCYDLGPINFILQLLHRTGGEAVLRRSLPELPSALSAS